VDEICKTIEDGQNILRERMAATDDEIRSL
jgi:hypothetical protein